MAWLSHSPFFTPQKCHTIIAMRQYFSFKEILYSGIDLSAFRIHTICEVIIVPRKNFPGRSLSFQITPAVYYTMKGYIGRKGIKMNFFIEEAICKHLADLDVPIEPEPLELHQAK